MGKSRNRKTVNWQTEDEPLATEGERDAAPLHMHLAKMLTLEIVRGQRQPGDLFPSELDMSIALSISRTAVRDAFRTLAAKGLVEAKSKRGTSVTDKSKWGLLDPDILGWMFESEPDDALVRNLFELRLILEPAVAGLAAQRRTLGHLTAMSQALDIMDRETLMTDAGRQADKDFHSALMAAAGNDQLSSLNASIGASIALSTRYKIEHDILGPDPVAAHRLVYDAIERRDAFEAKWCMESLIRQAMKDFVTTQYASLP